MNILKGRKGSIIDVKMKEKKKKKGLGRRWNANNKKY